MARRRLEFQATVVVLGAGVILSIAITRDHATAMTGALLGIAMTAFVSNLYIRWLKTKTYLPEGGECRCRACNYILKGLTEPRCPECGERI